MSDNGSPPSNKIYTLTVHIDSVNNNDPFFFGAPYIMEEPENLSVGELVINVYAFDMDGGNSGKVDVTIIGMVSR